MKEEGRKRTMMFIVVRFDDAPDGPLITWASPCISLFLIHLPPLELPTSLWKGEGQMQWGPHFQMCWVMIWAHIPQERGGAHFQAFVCGWWRIEVEKAEGVVVGWVEDVRKSTVMGLMGGFKLWFPSKIVLDIGLQLVDKKIKMRIIL